MIDTGEDVESALLGCFLEAVHGFLCRIRALHCYKAFGSEGTRGSGKQQGGYQAQWSVHWKLLARRRQAVSGKLDAGDAPAKSSIHLAEAAVSDSA
jgi:hypothetical protein